MVDAGRGKFNDFMGYPLKGHDPERPFGIPSRASIWNFDLNIPNEVYLAEMKIKSYAYYIGSAHSFIVCLFDRWGHIVKQWPEGEIPGADEIREAIRMELKKQGRYL